jgi:periplasmic divalent cation tolerance protein
MENINQQFIFVSITSPTRENAEKVASELVIRKLAACAQVSGSITSFFWWEGKVDKTDEYFIFVKTENRYLPSIRDVLTELHPYQVPELIALPIIGGGKDYLQWLGDSLKH